MNWAKDFKNGLDVGIKSFGFLWKYKILLLYLGVPIFIGITIELVIYNLFYFSPTDASVFVQGIVARMWESFGWIKHIGMLLTKMVTLLVTTFAAVALTHHTFAIIKKRKAGVRRSIKACLPKLDQIILWATISTCVFFLIHQLDLIFQPMYNNWMASIIPITVRIAWSLPMLFVVPAIALDEKPLTENIKQSPKIVKEVFFTYLGAFFWIGLIGLLAIIPLRLFLVKNALTLIVSQILVAVIYFTCATGHGILKTILYQEYVEKN